MSLLARIRAHIDRTPIDLDDLDGVRRAPVSTALLLTTCLCGAQSRTAVCATCKTDVGLARTH